MTQEAQDAVARDAPIHVGRVALVARDVGRLQAFYEDALGLSEIERDGDAVRLGVAGDGFLELRARPGARPSDPSTSGLFHTAFLLPSLGDLGSWLRHAADRSVRLEGASDHGVSDAVYLSDPEGNGIEIYADRPRAAWPHESGAIQMTTRRMDTAAVLAAGDGNSWGGAPHGTYVGHVHLRVGSVEAADDFYRTVIGLDPIVRMPKATFLSSGGYHHHIAANTWHSVGAGPRSRETSGLERVTLLARAPDAIEHIVSAAGQAGTMTQTAEGFVRLTDPFGIEVVVESV